MYSISILKIFVEVNTVWINDMVVSTIMYKSLSVYIISDIYCLCFLFAVTIPSIGEQSKCPRTSNNVCLINRKWNFTELRVFYCHNLT